MTKPKYCNNCHWSNPEEGFEWNLRCVNPLVNSDDSYALSAAKMAGTECSKERKIAWYMLPVCGKSGKQWLSNLYS